MTGCNRQVYIHIVWTTRNRQPALKIRFERAVHRIMHSEAIKLGCRIVAVNGTDDHIHVLVQVAATVTLACLVNQFKGVTSYFINDTRLDEEAEIFRWQDGYGAFSVGINQIRRVSDYIANQKQHHLSGNIHHGWEPELTSEIAI